MSPLITTTTTPLSRRNGPLRKVSARASLMLVCGCLTNCTGSRQNHAGIKAAARQTTPTINPTHRTPYTSLGNPPVSCGLKMGSNASL